jgi:penicillin G amidase
MTKTRVALLALLALLALPGASLAHRPKTKTETVKVAGLERPAKVLRDAFGVPHVFAKSEHDAYFMVGYLHAQDRLFQMDSSRRQASGTLAELLGPSALASDVQLRTIGLRRAAVRSLAAISPQARAVLEAYSAGVNAWLASNALPSEYAALELTKANVPAWTPLDSLTITKLITFGLSFETNDLSNTQKLIAYQTAGAQLGFDGRKLFFEDVMRSDPVAHAPSIFPGENSQPVEKHRGPSLSSSALRSEVGKAAREALRNLEAVRVPLAAEDQGSNVLVVSGKKSASGRPIVASDPHLSLPSPSVFYEIGVDVSRRSERLTLYGVTFPGAPAVVHGTNGHVSWGSTVNPTDVTDIYQEQLQVVGGVPVATTYKGNLEPTQIIPGTALRMTWSSCRRGAAFRRRRLSSRGVTMGRCSRSRAPPGCLSSSPASAPRARSISSACSRGLTPSGRRSTRSATSTSARRTGCTSTIAGTSATRRAARSPCARISRRAP